MMLLGDTPYTPCVVRNEFLFDEQHGQGKFTEGVVFAFRAEPGAVPMFSIMLRSGAQWARVPIHKICSKPCDPLPLEQSCWWDSYSYNFEVIRLAFLRGHSVTALGRDGISRTGNYLFTIDWMVTGWSEIPDQHKNHHVIALQTGQWIAYPNNRLIWLDSSWITPAPNAKWKSPTKHYSVE